jgi:hypothetical protein
MLTATAKERLAACLLSCCAAVGLSIVLTPGLEPPTCVMAAMCVCCGVSYLALGQQKTASLGRIACALAMIAATVIAVSMALHV